MRSSIVVTPGEGKALARSIGPGLEQGARQPIETMAIRQMDRVRFSAESHPSHPKRPS
jgi:hypothetical protein